MSDNLVGQTEAEDRYPRVKQILDSDVMSLRSELESIPRVLTSLTATVERCLRSIGFELSLTYVENYAGGIAVVQSDTWIRRFKDGVYVAVIGNRPSKSDFIHDLQIHARDQDSRINHALLITDHELDVQDWSMMQALALQGFTIIHLPGHLFYESYTDSDRAALLLNRVDERLGTDYDPYQATGPVYGAGNFFGRVGLLNKLKTALLEGEPQALFGIRRLGKSSILHHLKTKVRMPVALIDLQGGSTEILPLYERMLIEWARSVKQQFNIDWTPPQLPNDPTMRDEFAAAVRDLTQILEKTTEQPRIAVFVDEAELLLPEDSEPDNRQMRRLEFMRMLKSLSTEESNVLSILLASFDPKLVRESRWGRYQNPAHGLFEINYLDPLSAGDCAHMICSLGREVELEYSQSAIDLIYRNSGGHPFIARQICSRLLKRMKQGGEVKIGLLQQIIDEFVYNPDLAYIVEGLWSAMTSSDIWGEEKAHMQGELLRTIAAETGPSSIKRVIQGRSAARKHALEELKNLSLVQEVEPGCYDITIGCFKGWLREWQS